jgi:hypothetical protein
MAPSKMNIKKWFFIGAVIVPLLAGAIIRPVSGNIQSGNFLIPALADKIHLNFSFSQVLVCLLVIIAGTSVGIYISKKISGNLKTQKDNLILEMKSNAGPRRKV